MLKNRIASFILVVIFLSFLYAGCSGKLGQKVLAKVNDEVITLAEFQAKIDKLPPYYKALAAGQKDKFLDEIINEKLFLREAHKHGIDRNKDVRDLIEEAKSKIVISKFIEDQLSKNIKIADKEMEDYYKLHKKEFITPDKYKASHILVSTEADAKKVLDRLNKGEDFAKVAKEASIDPSKTNGGDLGYFTEGQMIPDFESACFKLKPGQTSGIVKTQFGYHIIKLTDKKLSETKTLSEVSGQIKTRLTDMKKMENLQAVIKQLRANSKITINKDLLETR